MNTSWIVLQILIGYNLILPVLIFLFAIVKKDNRKKDLLRDITAVDFDYAIIVTAFEQTHMLPEVVDSLLKLDYEKYHIYVVVDNWKTQDLNLSNPKVTFLFPDSTLASNTKSHFYAINRFERKHDIVTIIDSDNIVDSDYIKELNQLFSKDYVAVQGLRRAKNLDTKIACLDAARDIYYNFYDSEILFRLGSSSTLAGSGMAFKLDVFKNCLETLDIKGAGFDKVLQYQLLKKGYRIAYAPKAIVFDEKTSRSSQLINQRARWINTWFKYSGYGFELISYGIKERRLNSLLFGIILLRPPLFIFTFLSLSCFLINIFVNPLYSLYWFLSLFIFLIGFFIALIRSSTSRQIYSSLISVPKFIFYQFIALCFSKVASKRSIATKHINAD